MPLLLSEYLSHHFDELFVNIFSSLLTAADAIPVGTSYVAGSVTGATGVPPTFTVGTIPAGGSVTVTFKVQVDAIPNPNPMKNHAVVAFTYTLDPQNPDGVSGTATTNTVTTQVNTAVVTVSKTVDKAYAAIDEVITYTLTLQNSGNAPANQVTITDAVPAGTTFVAGSVTGATGFPPTLLLLASLAAGGSATVTFQVKVGNVAPSPNPIPNKAVVDFVYTVDPSQPNGTSATVESGMVYTLVSYANVTTIKTVDKEFANAGDVLTYTIVLQNSGNAAANNVIITDTIPAGTTFVAGSLVGATGVPPMLTLTTPVPANGSATVTFQVKVGAGVPKINPIPNVAAAAYTYTVDPSNPNNESGTTPNSTATTQVNFAKLVIEKRVDKNISYIGDTVDYQIAITNKGSVSANNVVLKDLLPVGTQIVAGTLIVSVPYAGSLDTGLSIMGAIAPGQTVIVKFKMKVLAMPIPNPIENTATGTYTYTVDPTQPDGVVASAKSNTVSTVVFRYNYSQQISDLISSVALEEAALAAIANSEGEKIQKMVAMGDVSANELLCLNRSVADMLSSISMLESVLKEKMNAVSCQINTDGSGC